MTDGWRQPVVRSLVVALFAFPAGQLSAATLVDCNVAFGKCIDKCGTNRPECNSTCDLTWSNCIACVNLPGFHSAQFCKSNGAGLSPETPPRPGKPPVASPGAGTLKP